jgi:peptidyl-tRNA hydrolase
MSVGKCSSQSGHAFLSAFLQADATRQRNYLADGIGTKVCLGVPTLEKLQAIHARACARGLPCALIEDTGRNTCFHGVPTITAVGVGPITRDEFPELRRLQLFT